MVKPSSARRGPWQKDTETNWYRALNEVNGDEEGIYEESHVSEITENDDDKTEPPSPKTDDAGDEPPHRAAYKHIDWDSDQAREIEKIITFQYGAKFKERGPPGPDQGGPTTWHGQKFRQGSQRWGNRGGKKAAEISAWFAEQREAKGKSKKGKGKTSEGKGKSKSCEGKGKSSHEGKGKSSAAGSGGKGSEVGTGGQSDSKASKNSRAHRVS